MMEALSFTLMVYGLIALVFLIFLYTPWGKKWLSEDKKE
jgi:hypothetical protein